jgi:multiple sugar transport system substrate-binding protein
VLQPMRIALYALVLVCIAGLVPLGVLASERVEITWLFSENPEDINLDKLISVFEEKNPHIKITPIWTPTRYEEKLHAMLASGDPPDVIRLNDDYVPAYADRGLLMPLDSLIERYGIDAEGFIPAFWEWPVMDGKHMAWVKGLTAEVLWVNVNAFEDAGVPLPPVSVSDGWTWDDFLETAKKLTRREGNRVNRWGCSLVQHLPSQDITWVVNNGGLVYSEDGTRFLLGEQAGTEALQWIADLTFVHSVQPPRYMFDQFSANDLFAAGSIAMCLGDSRQIPPLRRAVPEDIKWAARPLPSRVNARTGGALDTHAIPRDAKHPEEAFEWLAFLTSEEAYQIMGEVGFWLPVKTEWSDNWLPDVEVPLDKHVVIDALDRYLPVPKTKNTELARQIYWPQVIMALNGECTVAEALAPIIDEVNAVLNQSH